MKKINKFTYIELQKIRNLLPNNWEDDLHFIISNNISSNTIKTGNKFTIKVENYIINQPPNFSLSENWNGGTVPPEEVLDIEILQIMGKMIKIKAIGKCTNISWEGWLPQKSFKII
ncbi:MAG: hypothetical protein IJH55_07995 [Romboutsia sp.]|nr:hypothetical protein [Romboutsia sp.]